MTEHEYQALVRLYMAILNQAIKDATTLKETETKKVPVKARRNAQKWIESDSQMLDLCCIVCDTTKEKLRKTVDDLIIKQILERSKS